jgi:hypothetical protein
MATPMRATPRPPPEARPEGRRNFDFSCDRIVGWRGVPILIQDAVDDFRDSMCPDVDAPAFLADGIVKDGLAEMTSGLDRLYAIWSIRFYYRTRMSTYESCGVTPA